MLEFAHNAFFAIILTLAVPVLADEGNDIESFNAAYTAYKVHSEDQNFELALPEARLAYEIGRGLFGEGAQETPMLAFNYGVMLAQVGKNAEAEKELKDALTMYQSLYGKNAVELIPTLMQLGRVAGVGKRRDVMLKQRHFDRALKLAGKHYGRDSEKYGRLSFSAGRELLNRTGSRKSRKYLQDAYTVLSESLGAEDRVTGLAAYHLGRMYFNNGSYSASEPFLLAAVRTFSDPNRPATQIEIDTHARLVELYEETGEPEKASTYCLALGRVTPVTDDQEFLPIYRKAPRYPVAAYLRQSEGHVLFEFTVDESGIVRNPKTIEIEGHPSFEGAALEAIKRFRYPPRFVAGLPVATENVRSKLTFTIADEF